MSVLVTDQNNNSVQAFRLPSSGSSGVIVTLAAASAASPALSAGVYRIVSSANVTLSSGAVGSAATATDMELRANMPEYFYVNSGDVICAYDAGAGGATVSYTRMP